MGVQKDDGDEKEADAGNKPCREARSLYITQRAPAWFGARAEQATSTSADFSTQDLKWKDSKAALCWRRKAGKEKAV